MRGDDRQRQLRGVSIDSELADWLDQRSRSRNVGRAHIIETALMLLRDTDEHEPKETP